VKIRFSETVPSSHPDRPFLPGQVIDVACPTADMLRWLELGYAVAVREPDVLERAVAVMASVGGKRRKRAS
jgi:hypothetical protein